VNSAMTTLANVWMPSINKTKLTCQQND
jgi:hypothetical protein